MYAQAEAQRRLLWLSVIRLENSNGGESCVDAVCVGSSGGLEDSVQGGDAFAYIWRCIHHQRG